MAFSMHSHSGQFCPGHARDSLEEIVQRAISLKMHLYALTEHMPRNCDQDLYPEEIQAGTTTVSHLPLHRAFLTEALRLRTEYRYSITLLIGFEGEWIRPESSLPLVDDLLALPGTDFFIGSVHHVFEVPIDYDHEMYRKACGIARELNWQRMHDGAESMEPEARSGYVEGKSDDELLFEEYFDAQWEMLNALQPQVVGHFDLIRLFSERPDGQCKNTFGVGWPGVWMRIRRNLHRVVEMGALLEVNSSALRKGMKEPYPCRSICEVFMEMGGKFTLSDDSHGVAQVGLNYGRVSAYLVSLGITKLYYLERQPQDAGTESEGPLVVKEIPFTGLNSVSFPSSSPS